MKRAHMARATATAFFAATALTAAAPLLAQSGATWLRGAGEEITVRESRDGESAIERAARKARERREREIRGETRDDEIRDREIRDAEIRRDREIRDRQIRRDREIRDREIWRDRDVRDAIGDRDNRRGHGRGHAYGTDPAWHAAKDARKAEKRRMKEFRKAEKHRGKAARGGHGRR